MKGAGYKGWIGTARRRRRREKGNNWIAGEHGGSFAEVLSVSHACFIYERVG